MPIPLEQHLLFIKATAAYKDKFEYLMELIGKDIRRAEIGDITTSNISAYLRDLRVSIEYDIIELDRVYGAELRYAQRYYTEARVNETNKSKIDQRRRRIGSINLPPRAPTAIVHEAPEEEDYEAPLPPEKQKELEESEALKVWLNTPAKGPSQ